jgi:hypothetical protein
MVHRLTVEQERYTLKEMQNLEEYLQRAGFSRGHIHMATIYLSADLESLLLMEIQVLRVEYESFVAFLHNMEQRSERSLRLSRGH